MKTIPKSLKSLVKEDMAYLKVSAGLRQLYINGDEFCNYKCTK